MLFPQLSCSTLRVAIRSIWHNRYANKKQLPEKNTSRQLTAVCAQMPEKKFNHRPLRFLKSQSQVRMHLGCQIKPGAPTCAGKRQRTAILEIFTKYGLSGADAKESMTGESIAGVSRVFGTPARCLGDEERSASGDAAWSRDCQSSATIGFKFKFY